MTDANARLAAVEEARNLAEAELAETKALLAAKTARRANRTSSERTAGDRKVVAEAIEIFNKAAGHFGFTSCGTVTDAIARRLGRRIADIGGLEKFKAALRVLWQHSDNGFVMLLLGKLPGKDGRGPFRLDMQRLLQTDGNLGDVLARLLDIAGASDALQASAQSLAERLRAMSDEEQADLVRRSANGLWPVDVLFHPPGHRLCVIRPAAYRMAGIDEDTYDKSTGLLRGGRANGHG